MTYRFQRTLLAAGPLVVGLLLAGGCSLVSGFGDFSERDPSADGGGFDAGPVTDGGPDDDTGTADAAPPDECDGECFDDEYCCGGECFEADTIDDCGGCDIACPDRPNAIPMCLDQSCTIECESGFANCDGRDETGCLSITTRLNCGECGTRCLERPNSDSICGIGNSCELVCDDGFEDCDGDASNGCEQSLVSPEHCGACGQACPGDQVCDRLDAAYTCADGCRDTETNCGGSCVLVGEDPSHCTGCGGSCPPLPNSAPVCTNGTCGVVCSDGFEDCDGQPDNGCEEMLTLQYPDRDEDGYGAGTGTLACANTPFMADRDGDCDDTKSDVNPGASEVCDGLDNDCNNLIDDPDITNTLECGPGSPPMTCTGGNASCSFTGNVECNQATCSFSTTCTPPAEACNRSDDNCEGFVDEGASVLRLGQPLARQPFATAGLRTTSDPATGQIAAVWLDSNDSTKLFFGRFRQDGLSLGAPVLVKSGRFLGFDVASNGTEWAVVYATTSVVPSASAVGATFYRVATGGMSGVRDNLVPQNSQRNAYILPRVERIGASADFAVAFSELTDPNRPALTLVYVTMATGGGFQSAVPFPVDEGNSGDLFGEPALASMSEGGTALVYRRQLNGDQHQLRFTVVQAPLPRDGTAPHSRPVDVFTTSTNQPQMPEMTYDPNGRVLGVVYRQLTRTGQFSFRLAMLSQEGRLQREAHLTDLTGTDPTSIPTPRIASAADASFGVAYLDDGRDVFARYRASDLNLVPESVRTPPPGFATAVEGFPTSDIHYLLLSNQLGTTQTIASQVVGCAP